MGNTVHNAEDVIAAIRGSAGIKTTIAKRLNVSRPTVDDYLKRWVTVNEAYQTEKAGIDDAAQSVVINDILQNRSVETAKWWLRVKCADEFNPPTVTEISGPGGRPIEYKEVKELSDSELQSIAAAGRTGIATPAAGT